MPNVSVQPCGSRKTAYPINPFIIKFNSSTWFKMKSKILQKSQWEPTLMGGHGALHSCHETYPVVILQVRSHCPCVTCSHKNKEKKRRGGDHSFIHSQLTQPRGRFLPLGDAAPIHLSTEWVPSVLKTAQSQTFKT